MAERYGILSPHRYCWGCRKANFGPIFRPKYTLFLRISFSFWAETLPVDHYCLPSLPSFSVLLMREWKQPKAVEFCGWHSMPFIFDCEYMVAVQCARWDMEGALNCQKHAFKSIMWIMRTSLPARTLLQQRLCALRREDWIECNITGNNDHATRMTCHHAWIVRGLRAV